MSELQGSCTRYFFTRRCQLLTAAELPAIRGRLTADHKGALMSVRGPYRHGFDGFGFVRIVVLVAQG